MKSLREWNVIVSVREGVYQQTKALLKELGQVGETPYYNILVMWVPDTIEALEELHRRYEEQPKIKELIGHFIPVTHIFHFTTPEEFEKKAKETVQELLPQLANKTFHVRMQRHGFKDRIESSHEEKILGEMIQKALEQAGTPARVGFDNPDAILVVETVSQQAGLAIWSRDDFIRFPLLRIT